MAAELKVLIGAEIKDFLDKLGYAEKKLSDFEKKTESLTKIGDRLTNLGTQLTLGLTVPIIGLGTASIKSFGEIQSLQKGLEAVMGSASAAGNEFEKLKGVAKLPGLGLEEAVKGSINLQSIGIDAEKSRNILLQFGNAVATVGKGRAEFERAIYGVQQLANTDFPLGEDLNIIKDAIPQITPLLKEAFGTARSEELQKLGISSQQVLGVITSGLEKLPRVNGGVKGAFENLSDSVKVSLGKVGEIIDKNLNITGLLDKVSNGINNLVDWFARLSPSVQTGILAFAGLAAALGPVLLAIGAFMSALPTILTGVGAISTALTALTGPIGLVVLGVGAVIAVFVTQWSKIKPIIINTINYFIDLYNESLVFRAGIEGIALTFKNLWSVVKGVARIIWDTIKTLAKGIITAFGAVGDVMKGAFTLDFDLIQKGVGDFYKNVGETAKNLYKNLGSDIKGIFNDIGDNVSNFLDKTINGNKKARITDIKVGIPGLPEATQKEVENGVNDGLSKAEKKLKDKIKGETIEIPVALPKIKMPELDVRSPSLFSPEQIEEQKKRISSGVNILNQELQSGYFGLSESIREMNIGIQAALLAMIPDFIKEGITNAFVAMGGAIANGGNILQAAGAAILSTLGQFMQMLGKEMIKLAVATIALGNLVKGIKKWIIANPGAAIALAGVAIAVGTLLSAAASNIGGGSSGGGSSSGGSYSTSSVNSSPSYSSSYSSNYSSGGNLGGEVVFRISGNDLVGVLSRQQDKNTRLGG